MGQACTKAPEDAASAGTGGLVAGGAGGGATGGGGATAQAQHVSAAGGRQPVPSTPQPGGRGRGPDDDGHAGLQAQLAAAEQEVQSLRDHAKELQARAGETEARLTAEKQELQVRRPRRWPSGPPDLAPECAHLPVGPAVKCAGRRACVRAGNGSGPQLHLASGIMRVYGCWFVSSHQRRRGRLAGWRNQRRNRWTNFKNPARRPSARR